MILQFRIFNDQPRLVHAVTTTKFDGHEPFNLADHVGPNRADALLNRRRLCDALHLSFDRLTLGEQVHGSTVAIVDSNNAGRGATGRHDAIKAADALIATLPDVPLMALSADCPLILLYAPDHNALAVVHASWRAQVGGIISKTVTLLTDCFACTPDALMAGISPSAGPCCYVVREDFCNALSETPDLRRFIVRSGNTGRFDLRGAARASLVTAGLNDENIETMDICTICDKRFFSYRRDGRDAGRFALMAAIKSPR